ncbi:Protein F40E3.5 [Aphelenchoides avenae]|nr:Protein F40E3.5 [Aphelenchus avenae]
MSAFLRNVEVVIASEPSVITSIKGTICVVGDLHGQADSLISLISLAGFPSPDLTYVFLGNYTGEGFAPHETLFMLFAFKLRYPDNVYLLRGNNEDTEVLKAHKFPLGLELRGLMETPAPWTYIQRIVDVLPLAALIKGHYFCVHGGIGPELKRCGISGLKAVKRPPKEPQHVLLTRECQWATYRNESALGATETYSDGSPGFVENDVTQFCNDYLGGIYGLIIRSRQIAKGVLNRPEQMMTVWSAASFLDAFRNKAAVLKINTDTDEAEVIRYKVPDKEPESLADIKPVSGRNAVVLTE